MFEAGKSVPKIGEIRFGYVDSPSSHHKYVGIHPYLVVSNNMYNKHSGQAEVIPFTTKRGDWSNKKRNPAHVDYAKGEVAGLSKNSTLVIEGRDTLSHSQLSEPIGTFTDENWRKAANAMVVQCPFIAMAFSDKNKACS